MFLPKRDTSSSAMVIKPQRSHRVIKTFHHLSLLQGDDIVIVIIIQMRVWLRIGRPRDII